MRSLFLAASVLLLSIVASGCDKSGIHDLGRAKDVVQAATTPTTTWVRSTDPASGETAGTEILLIGVNSDTAAVTDATAMPLMFARGFIAHDSSTTLDLGTYELDAQGNGTFTYDAHYSFVYEPTKAILSRTGSVRTDLSPPTMESLAIAADAKTLLVTLNGTQHRFTGLLDLVKSIDPSTPAGATAMFRVYNLPLFMSQNRLLGFGSAGMAQYVVATDFLGMISGKFNVSVESYVKPNVTISYAHFQDLTGIDINGDQFTYVNLNGDGTMSGGPSFTITDPATNTVVVSGSCDYSPITIANGIAAGGHYNFTIDGYGTTVQDYTLAANVDLSDVLPITTP